MQARVALLFAELDRLDCDIIFQGLQYPEPNMGCPFLGSATAALFFGMRTTPWDASVFLTQRPRRLCALGAFSMGCCGSTLVLTDASPNVRP